MEFSLAYKPGDIVYVIMKSTNAQKVASVERATIISSPDLPGELALIVQESCCPLTDETAVYQSAEEAQQAYHSVFGGELYG